MPSKPAVLGFTFGVATIVLGFFIDYPPLIGIGLIVFIFGGWLFFAVRERMRNNSP